MVQWYYGENGQQAGPIDEGAFRQAILEGRVGPQTLVWREGMPSWVPLAQVQELAPQTPHPVSPGAYPHTPYTPVPGYGQSYAPTSGMAITSMVCGIAGLVTCLIFLGIPAVICGHLALNQINDSALPMNGKGMAISGLVMGYLQILCCLAGVVAIVLAIASQ